MNVDQAALFLQALNCKQIRRKSNNWVSAHLARAASVALSLAT